MPNIQIYMYIVVSEYAYYTFDKYTVRDPASTHHVPGIFDVYLMYYIQIYMLYILVSKYA